MEKINIQDIINYIEDNLKNEFSLTDVAKKVNYSPYEYRKKQLPISKYNTKYIPSYQNNEEAYNNMKDEIIYKIQEQVGKKMKQEYFIS